MGPRLGIMGAGRGEVRACRCRPAVFRPHAPCPAQRCPDTKAVAASPREGDDRLQARHTESLSPCIEGFAFTIDH